MTNVVTNLVCYLVVNTVTNWGPVHVPEHEWTAVANREKVPAARLMIGTVEQQHVAKITWEGQKFEKVMKSIAIGYVEREGVAVERVMWRSEKKKPVDTIKDAKGNFKVVVIDRVLQSGKIVKPKKEEEDAEVDEK